MKQGVWAEQCKDVLVKQGFIENKPHIFRKLSNGILFHVEFIGKKQDIYIWFSMLPISMPNIWTAVGYGKAAGRVPSEEKAISCKTEQEITNVQAELLNLLSEEVIPLFDTIDCVESYNEYMKSDEAILVHYPLGFGLLQAGEFSEAFNSFEIISGIEFLPLEEEKETIKKLSGQEQDRILEQLQKYENKNISKLGLSST